MKKTFAVIGLLLLSIFSTALLVESYSSYSSGYPLVIENHNAFVLDLYFVAGDGRPATAFTQFHQQMRVLPKLSIAANSVLLTNFESSGDPPSGALVSYGIDLRNWRFDAQRGGRVSIPAFTSLPEATPAAILMIKHNWSFRGILAMVIQVTLVATTILLWFRKFRPRPREDILV